MKKFLVLLLALSMLLCVFAGCKGNTETPSTDTKPPVDDSDETTPPTPEPTYDDLVPVDLDGRVFHIMTRDSGSTVLWKPIDWDSDGTVEEEIPMAVFKRNSQVEEDFNCTIEQVEVPNTEMVAYANAAYFGDTREYDVVVMPIIHQMTSMATSGYYRDLTTVDSITVEDPWWSAWTNDSLSLFGHYYTLCGDINILDDLSTWCVMFNKFMVEDWQLENHYDMVANNTWTWENMYKNAAMIADEMHNPYGSGLYGIATEFDVVTAYVAAAGLTTVSKSDESLQNNTKSHNFENVISKIYDNLKNDTVQVFGDNTTDGSKGYSAVNWGSLYNIFVADSAMYLTGTISNLIGAQLGEMASPIGILPMPKYTEDQEHYITTMQGGNGTGASVFSNLPDENVEQIGTLLTAMAAASVDTLTPAFYDKVLYGRKVPDPDSSDMMDMILENRVVDLGVILSPQVRSILSETVKTRTGYNFVSIRTNYAKALEDGLFAVTDAIKNNFQNTEE